MKSFGFFFLFIIHINVFTQVGSARNIALGNTFLSHDDILSAGQNISKLYTIKGLSVGVSTQNQFTLKELQRSLFTVGFPVLRGTSALIISHFGFDLYKEIQFAFAYSIQLNPKISIGIKITYHQLYLGENHGSTGSIYPDIAMNYRFSDKIELGLLLNNLTLSKVNSSWEQYWPINFNTGLKYTLNYKVTMFLETSLLVGQNIRFKYGIEYLAHPLIALRIGVNSYPSSFSIGFGLKLKSISLDFASSYNSIMGFSPAISIRYEPLY